jgi:hypothetical protein
MVNFPAVDLPGAESKRPLDRPEMNVSAYPRKSHIDIVYHIRHRESFSLVTQPAAHISPFGQTANMIKMCMGNQYAVNTAQSRSFHLHAPIRATIYQHRAELVIRQMDKRSVSPVNAAHARFSADFAIAINTRDPH